jgi:exonuclease SbcD
MKILHTSDWHLGQKFMGKSREEEHIAFLDWLVSNIKTEEVDVLIVAGDIFDTGTPPNYALELYYHFLTKLLSTQCKTIVILGGNHDSVSTLQTSSPLLKELNIYVIASGDENEETLIKCYKEEKLQAVICAVPFLRDSVVRKSISGESSKEKDKSLAEGIEQYYKNIHKEAFALVKGKEIPIIATGHLTTVGGRTSDSERELYIGNSLNITSDFLAELFDYVALGHLHHAQKVSHEHVRYSGSPIPLSFSEAGNEKSVSLITFSEKSLHIELLPIPLHRVLYRLKGDKENLKEKLLKIDDKSAWIEIEIQGDNTYATLQSIQAYADELELTILAKKIIQTEASAYQEDMEVINLNEVTPYEVFEKRLDLENIENTKLTEDLKILFQSIETEVATA